MISLRPYRMSDAARFLEILSSKNFKFIKRPTSLAEERRILKKIIALRKKKLEFSYAILYRKELVGGCGIKTYGPPHIGELGYFVAEEHWRKGIATAAVTALEKIAKKKKIKRLEIRVDPTNKASVNVAKKAGYKKEGRLKAAIFLGKKYIDADLYVKIL